MEFNLNGLRMVVTSVSHQGALSFETRFDFEQTDQIVTARYRGGRIADGHLVGWLNGGSLDFRYVQIEHGGQLDSGVSRGIVERLTDGRLRITENFQWETRAGFGVNIFEEPLAPSATRGAAH